MLTLEAGAMCESESKLTYLSHCYFFVSLVKALICCLKLISLNLVEQEVSRTKLRGFMVKYISIPVKVAQPGLRVCCSGARY